MISNQIIYFRYGFSNYIQLDQPENQEFIKFKGTANTQCFSGVFTFEDDIKATFTMHLTSLMGEEYLAGNEQDFIIMNYHSNYENIFISLIMYYDELFNENMQSV